MTKRSEPVPTLLNLRTFCRSVWNRSRQSSLPHSRDFCTLKLTAHEICTQSQIFRLQSSVLCNSLQRHRPDFNRVVPSPCVVFVTGTLQLGVRTTFFCFRHPSDPKQSAIDDFGFAARPLAHRNVMDFGGLRASWVRSAITRSANAVTSTSASRFVLP